jgi:hypothetical protein
MGRLRALYADPGRVAGRARTRSGLLTRQRVRNYSLILCIGGVLALGTSTWVKILDPSVHGVLLPDFLAHWTGGRLLLHGSVSDLYDAADQQTLQREVGLPAGDLAWFVSPPVVAALFLPFALLPYVGACAVWTVLSLTLLWAALRRAAIFAPALLARERRLVVLAVLGSYPVFELLGGGQDSSLSLLVWVVGIACVLKGREVAAGLVFSVGLIKPQLVVVVPLLFLVQRRFKGFMAFCLGAGVLAMSCLAVAGRDGLMAWLAVLNSPLYTEQVTVGQSWKMVGLPSLVASLSSPAGPEIASALALSAAVGLVVLFVLGVRQRSRDSLTCWVAALATTVAASPHLVVYDAVLLIPVALFALEHIDGGSVAPLLVLTSCCAWLMPLSHVGLAGHGVISILSGAPWVAVPVTLLWWRVLAHKPSGPSWEATPVRGSSVQVRPAD